MTVSKISTHPENQPFPRMTVSKISTHPENQPFPRMTVSKISTHPENQPFPRMTVTKITATQEKLSEILRHRSKGHQKHSVCSCDARNSVQKLASHLKYHHYCAKPPFDASKCPQKLASLRGTYGYRCEVLMLLRGTDVATKLRFFPSCHPRNSCHPRLDRKSQD